MSLTKQAKILTEAQVEAVLKRVAAGAHPERDRVMVLLSVKAGLRAKEIGALTWGMLTDAEGRLVGQIALPNSASKGKRGGRHIPMNGALLDALLALRGLEREAGADDPVICSDRNGEMSAQVVINWFWHLYKDMGFQGASSHSGRRTFITGVARKITQVGGSLRDVQELAGHASLSTTQRYIGVNEEAQRRVVGLL